MSSQFWDKYEMLNKYIEKLLSRESHEVVTAAAEPLEKVHVLSSSAGGPEVKANFEETENSGGSNAQPHGSGTVRQPSSQPPKNDNQKDPTAAQGLQGKTSEENLQRSQSNQQASQAPHQIESAQLQTSSMESQAVPNADQKSQEVSPVVECQHAPQSIAEQPQSGSQIPPGVLDAESPTASTSEPQSAAPPQLQDSVHNAQGTQEVQDDPAVNQDLPEKPTIPKQEIRSKEELAEMIKALNARIQDYEEKLIRAQSRLPFEEMSMHEFCDMVRVGPLENEDGTASFWPHTEEEQKPGAFGIQEADMEAIQAKPLITKEDMEKFEKEMVAKLREEDGVTVPEGTSPLHVVPPEKPPKAEPFTTQEKAPQTENETTKQNAEKK